MNSKRNIRKGIKRNKYKFNNKIINFEKYFCSIENYKHSYPFVHKDKVIEKNLDLDDDGVADINIEFEVVADLLLRAWRLGDETQVLDCVTATDDELVGVPLHELDRGDIEREVSLLAVLGFDAE